MSGRQRLLSKSRFVLASECPAKLFYAGKHAEYADTTSGDEFLKALADCGYQVEALAKCQFPGGTEIDTLVPEQALQRTAECLEKDPCVIYQAAFRHGPLIVRVDTVRRVGHSLLLYEVKAKSWDLEEDEPFFDKRALKKGQVKLKEKYRSSLLDIAYQTFVARKHYPHLQVNPHLLFVNKVGVAESDGINQRFLLYRNPDGRRRVDLRLAGTDSTLGRGLLCAIPVEAEVAKVLAKEDFAAAPDFEGGSLTFEELAVHLAKAYESDQRLVIDVGKQCKGCQFEANEEATKAGLKSGFEECWASQRKRRPDGTPLFRLWNCRSAGLFSQGKYFIEDVDEGDVEPKGHGRPGLSTSERQWLQVRMTKAREKEPYVDLEGLSSETDKWVFPYHFIDFETTRVPIPFNKGRRAYEQIAFQFSHHVVQEDGQIEHRGEWINDKKGFFPNFEFVRQLKAQLSSDNGTIFRYAVHENTTLVEIHRQLQDTSLDVVPDRGELCAWIQTITESKREGSEWCGPRSMVDMCELVKRHFLHPLMVGSNSLKAVLPAVLSSSRHIQKRYSRPIYGAKDGIPSCNFSAEPMAWVQCDDRGKVKDPYSLLKPIFTDYDQRTLDRISPVTEIGDGGAAMVAYARMQFTEISDIEAQRIVAALLRYCELDTFAMVLLYEHWMELLGRVQARPAA